MSTKLMPGKPVPPLAVPIVGGGTWDIAAQTPAAFTMIVVYRGYHCPVCKSYLGTLNGLAADYAAAGLSVIALSMDDEARAAKAKAEWDVGNLTIGHGLSEATAAAWGLWLSAAIRDGEPVVFAEPGVFWVRPSGELYLVDIANMPWARPDLAVLLSKAPLIAERDYPARGTHPAA